MMKIISTPQNYNAALDVQQIVKKEIISPSIENFCGDEKILFFNKDIEIPNSAIIVHSLWPNTNDNLIELLLLLDCLENSGTKQVTLITPYLPFLRQDRQLKNKSSIGSKVLAKLLSNIIINNIITLDVHSKNAINFFGDILINIEISDFFAEKIKKIIPQESQNMIVVSPDSGSIHRAKNLADLLDIDYLALSKLRTQASVEISGFPANKKFEIVIIIDDIIDSGSTILSCINHIKSNVTKIIICATHIIDLAVLEKIKNAKENIEIITTNSTNYNNKFNNIYPLLAQHIPPSFNFE